LIKSEQVVICGQIRQEVLQGSRDKEAFAKLQEQMSLWDYEAEAPEDFLEAARIFATLRWQGITLPPTDCLIAAVAVRRHLLLYSHDPDFDQITHLLRHMP
jgi:predicted nucleic acid-binding protein